MSEQASLGWIIRSIHKRSGATETFEVAISTAEEAVEAVKNACGDDPNRIVEPVEKTSIAGLPSGKVRQLATHRKRPRDANQLAKSIVDIATGEASQDDGKDAAAVSLGRRGGLKGGRARAEKLTPEQRAEIAKIAAAARWKKRD